MSKRSSSQLYQYQPEPIHSGADAQRIKGSYRLLELDGRKGINPTSIDTLIEYPLHTLNSARGSLTYWVFALEDVFTFLKRDVMFTGNNKSPNLLPILSDHPDLGNFSEAGFLFTYEAAWHPAFLAKFYKGDVFMDAIRAPQKAYSMASAFEIHKNRWYQFTLTWDFEKEEIFIYANGVPIASSDRFHTAFSRDTTGPSLYSGKPVFCFGELVFHDEVLAPSRVEDLFHQQATSVDKQFQADLRQVYAGENSETFNWEPNEEWLNRLVCSFSEPGQLDAFRIQGNPEKVEITGEGLHIRTPSEPYEPQNHEKQMYLWSHDSFEGDIYVEYEFRANQAFGLSLLVFQASGMSREDFMADYPRRTEGNMHTVHSSDVRNYHLEYFRRMTAVRNDVDTVALIKNPYQLPIGFGSLGQRLRENTWHRLQVRQMAEEIIVALNGVQVIRAIDQRFFNNGPVLNSGHIAIRCMINTDMHFRNLRVANRKLPYREILRSGSQPGR